MTTFTDVFGGDTVPPSENAYASYNVSASISLVWPEQYSGTDTLLANILELNVTVAALTATLPPADAVSVGRDILIRNTGTQSIDVVDNAAGAVATIAAGESKFVYVKTNATPAGTWGVFTYGTGTSGADASALAGYGLKAISGKLHSDHPYIEKNGNYTVQTSDRGKAINVTAGTVTITLPQASVATAGFFVLIRNSSIGMTTVDGFGTELVNGELTFGLSPDESAIFVCSGSGWYTVGYGRDVDFTFGEYVVNAATGSIVLSASDVSGRMIRIGGTAAGNITVTLPAVDNIYFVNVEIGMGGFTATFTTGSGSVVDLTANNRTALYCDGTNVTPAITTALTTNIVLDDGSATVPTLFFDLDTDTGLFRSGDGQLAIASNGAQVGYFDSLGWNGDVQVTAASNAVTAAAGTNTTQIATTAYVFAERSNALTLTNKTVDLTNNTLTGTIAQFNTALSDGDFATLAGAEALSNKTVNLSNNTLTGTTAEFNAALSDDNFATLTNAVSLTNKTVVDPILTLSATEGTAGQVPTSQGPGLPPVWGSSSTVGTELVNFRNRVILTTGQTFTAPENITQIRAYCVGPGGAGSGGGSPRGGGGGGSMAYATIPTTSGTVWTANLNVSTMELKQATTVYLSAPGGSNASAGTGGAGGSGAVVTPALGMTDTGTANGGAGGTATNGFAGGGASGSPIGTGGAGGAASAANASGGGGGWGGAGGSSNVASAGGGGGGAGGAGSAAATTGGNGGGSGGVATAQNVGPPRAPENAFTDPLLRGLDGAGGVYSSASGTAAGPGGPGGGGGGALASFGGAGGFGGGSGGGSFGALVNSRGGFGGGGGGGAPTGGPGGLGGGGGAGTVTGGTGGAGCVVIFY